MPDQNHRREHWQTVWTEQDPERVSWFQDECGSVMDVIARTGLRKGAGVIDVGGGASPLIGGLAIAGWTNLAVLDVSEAALDANRNALGPMGDDVMWIAEDVLNWRPVPGLFDLWHDRAAFHFFTDPADRAAYADILKTALAPGGWVIIAGFAPDGPERCSGLPVHRASDHEMQDLLGDQFTLVEAADQEHLTPKGTVQKFRIRVFQRDEGR